MQLRPPIEWLHGAGTPDAMLMGSKAARLARLARAGLPVPEGFCLGPQAFWQSLRRLGITQPGDRTQACLEALRSVALSPEIEAAVADALRRLGNGPFAVRSSALDEDAADLSFAGQYQSLLNLEGLAGVLVAIRETWASYFDARVETYRSARGDEAGRGGMAVLVQRMVDARRSGILFTVNPLNGSRRELTIEASLGLCEDLASGNVHPDQWVCRRPHRSRTAQGLEILEKTPAPGRAEPLMQDYEVLALAQMGLRIESMLGGPQDIEWSLDGRGELWLLQSRPITSLEKSLTRQRRSRLLWTQRFSGERWTQQASPLGWSVIQPVLHHFIHWEEASQRYLHDSAPTMLYRGAPYFNISIFRHLVFRLPGMAPIQFLLEFFPPDEQEELRRRRLYLPNLGLVGSIMKQVVRERRWRRYKFNFLTNHKAWERFVPRFLADLEQLDDRFETTDVGLREYRKARDLVYEYVEIHLLSLLFANVFYQLLGTSLRRWVGDHDHQLRAALTSAPSENRTVEGHKALWKLAGLAQQIPAIDAALTSSNELPDLDELAGLQDGQPFVDALGDFLDEFGHRSAASWEIFATRWSEDPQVVLQMIAGYLQGGIHTDPYLNEERHQQAYLAALERLEGQLRSTPLQKVLPWKAGASRALLEMTQVYMRLRENQRFHYDQLLFKIKRILLRIGELLADQGKLEAPADIVLLEIDEIRQLAHGALPTETARERIARRRDEARRDEVAEHPEFLVGEGMPVPSDLDERRVLTGMGISPGRITGKVRVLRDLRESRKLERGDILVTRATDPGWTPLFLTAGGLVMELGSLLSHGAVVAREYALPAVVNVANATRRLHDGQEIALDGAKGMIYIL